MNDSDATSRNDSSFHQDQPLPTDDDVQCVLNRGSDWQSAARRITWHAFESLQKEEVKLENAPEHDEANNAFYDYLAEMLAKIENGSFLHSFDPDTMSGDDSLVDKAVRYMTKYRKMRRWDKRKNRDAKAGRVFCKSWSDNVAEIAQQVQSRPDFDENEDKGQDLPVPKWLEVPQQPPMTWRTAVHMCWPRVEFESEAEQALREEALKELEAAAEESGNSPEIWMRQHAESAQSQWEQDIFDLRVKLEKKDRNLQKLLNDIRLHEQESGHDEPEAEAPVRKNSTRSKLNNARQDYKASHHRLNRTLIESHVLQFRGREYVELLGDTTNRNTGDARRSRLVAQMDKIFFYGNIYKDYLSRKGGSVED